MEGIDENEEAVQPSLEGGNLGIDIDTYEQSHTVNNNNGEILTEINEKRTEAKASGQKTEKTHNFKEQSIVLPKHRINAIRGTGVIVTPRKHQISKYKPALLG
ncbi:hypothetical protein BB561_006898, partial [Smittium simulii]